MKITPALLLLAFWLVLTEKLTLERFLVGIFAVGVVLLLNADFTKPKRAFARRMRAGALFRCLLLDARMALRLKTSSPNWLEGRASVIVIPPPDQRWNINNRKKGFKQYQNG